VLQVDQLVRGERGDGRSGHAGDGAGHDALGLRGAGAGREVLVVDPAQALRELALHEALDVEPVDVLEELQRDPDQLRGVLVRPELRGAEGEVLLGCGVFSASRAPTLPVSSLVGQGRTAPVLVLSTVATCWTAP
jgi:hypothetical protein